MPILLILGIAAVIGLFVSNKNAAAESGSADIVLPGPPSNIMGLPDCLPEHQHGVYRQDYDEAFEAACIEFKIPFGLLKAHAIRESALKSSAYRQEPNGKASYGLMQILWWPQSNRFADWGYTDDQIGDGSLLYDPVVNTRVAAQLIADNWQTYGNIRDTINAYNTGVSEARHVAPGNYVDDVLNYYSTLVGVTIS